MQLDAQGPVGALDKDIPATDRCKLIRRMDLANRDGVLKSRFSSVELVGVK